MFTFWFMSDDPNPGLANTPVGTVKDRKLII